MKKKVRVPPTNPFYSSEPAVSRTQVAAKPLVPSASLGSATPKMVDKKPARMSGVAGFVSKARPTTKPTHISVPKLGTKSNFPTQGKLKASGHSGAHRVGFKSKI